MQEMLDYIVKNIVSSPDAVEIADESKGKTKIFRVSVLKKDLGAVIGRNGNIANAIRTVVKSLGNPREKLVIKFDAKNWYDKKIKTCLCKFFYCNKNLIMLK